ncbi:receptor-like protein EIX2 [Salvia hispanica]|uniref:receptor-like protein EIX2 n=1 Tax=Salvia hispanica TaxID=49212 RepID=UPI0020099C16|nr:receptor-like protein EIX2 [Salvia hispanica]
MNQLHHLNLSNSSFSRIVPPQLGNLTNLRSLVLSFNSLTSMSLSILKTSVLKSLEILNLSVNQFNGSMPDLRAFPSLTELYLFANNFTGSIPLSIGQLSELQVLDHSFNSLEGLVNESHFSKLDNLKSLDLSYNPLLILDIAPDWSPPFQLANIHLARCNVGPTFPKWIHTQRNFASLDLHSANIRDEAPWWLWRTSSSLQFLYLSDNELSGRIPKLSSTSIEYMDVSYNNFSGPIPLFPPNVSAIFLNGNIFSGSISSICKTSHDELSFLDLSNNRLGGQVPNCWEKVPNMVLFNVANNSFSGEIPRSLGALHNLSVLQMRGNSLSGELPYNLRLCQELRIFDIGGNKLTGEIPTWIGQLYRTQFLKLQGNKLHGSIPLEICNLTNIQVLDFSINNLSWIIPDCFNNFTVLSGTDIPNPSISGNIFDPLDNGFVLTDGKCYHIRDRVVIDANRRYIFEYSSFQWKGRESKYWENLRLLKLIDFSSNGLTGNIPKSFSNMSGIRSLNLSRNSLTGYIIPDIGKMEMLDSLDLSHNQLSGEIPTSLAAIYGLGDLDLSNNKLSRKIPTGTQLQSFNPSAYAGNDGLCGDPLPKCPGDSLRPSTTIPMENMNENDVSMFSFMQEVGIAMAFGFIFGFWGVIGSFILKKSWRIAFFNLFDAAGDWFHVTIAVFISKCRRS